MDDIILPEGYTIGNLRPSHYNCFSIFKDGKRIGDVGWHGYHYTEFNAGKSNFTFGDYVKGENPRQKAAEKIIAMHKVLGDINLKYGTSMEPNVLMTRFDLKSAWVLEANVRKIHFATIEHKIDGNWHLTQHYGEGCGVFSTPQEAVDMAAELVREKNKTENTKTFPHIWA